MAKARNTFAKRQRETEKRRKAEDKKARRLQKKQQDQVPAAGPNEPSFSEQESEAAAPQE